jgi:hypothetical protein
MVSLAVGWFADNANGGGAAAFILQSAQWATDDVSSGIHHPKESLDNDVQWRRIQKSSWVIGEKAYSFKEDQNEYLSSRKLVTSLTA